MSITGAQGSGGPLLWALATLLAIGVLAWAIPLTVKRLRAALAFPDLDFSRGYDALAPITGRLYLIKR